MSTGEKLVAFGFVGRWKNGSLGWHVPAFLYRSTGRRRYPTRPERTAWNEDTPMELCRITIEPMRDKLGRRIVRYVGRKASTRRRGRR